MHLKISAVWMTAIFQHPEARPTIAIFCREHTFLKI
jgi:hypothetical protein